MLRGGNFVMREKRRNSFGAPSFGGARARSVTLIEFIMFTVVAGVLVAATIAYVNHLSQVRWEEAFSREFANFQIRHMEITANRTRPFKIPTELYKRPSIGGLYSGPVILDENPTAGEYFGFDVNVLTHRRNYSTDAKERVFLQAIHEKMWAQQNRTLGTAPSATPPGGWTQDKCKEKKGVYNNNPAPPKCNLPLDDARYVLWMALNGLNPGVCHRIGKDLTGVVPRVATISTGTYSYFFKGNRYMEAPIFVICQIPPPGRPNINPSGSIVFRGYRIDCDACY